MLGCTNIRSKFSSYSVFLMKSTYLCLNRLTPCGNLSKTSNQSEPFKSSQRLSITAVCGHVCGWRDRRQGQRVPLVIRDASLLCELSNTTPAESWQLLSLPLCMILGFGKCWCFRQVEGLLQCPLQVSHPLLDHFSDVLDPLLFGFHTGGLGGKQSW